MTFETALGFGWRNCHQSQNNSCTFDNRVHFAIPKPECGRADRFVVRLNR
jgi:hypothetical protein